MTCSYGGIPLCVPTPEIKGWVRDHIRLEDIYPFSLADRIRHTQDHLPRQEPLRDTVQVGTLRWPRGASRWAVGHYLATSAQLERIRDLAYSGPAEDQSQPLPLVLGRGTFRISTDLFLLPSLPLSKAPFPAHNGLHLLTLVDDRYWWWYRAATVTIDPGTTTWDALYTGLATALGVTLVWDAIDAAYLKPTDDFDTQYGHLPPLLDAVASSVGQVVVRDLDGVVYAQSPATALAYQRQTLSQPWPRAQSGGEVEVLQR